MKYSRAILGIGAAAVALGFIIGLVAPNIGVERLSQDGLLVMVLGVGVLVVGALLEVRRASLQTHRRVLDARKQIQEQQREIAHLAVRVYESERRTLAGIASLQADLDDSEHS